MVALVLLQSEQHLSHQSHCICIVDQAVMTDTQATLA